MPPCRTRRRVNAPHPTPDTQHYGTDRALTPPTTEKDNRYGTHAETDVKCADPFLSTERALCSRNATAGRRQQASRMCNSLTRLTHSTHSTGSTRWRATRQTSCARGGGPPIRAPRCSGLTRAAAGCRGTLAGRHGRGPRWGQNGAVAPGPHACGRDAQAVRVGPLGPSPEGPPPDSRVTRRAGHARWRGERLAGPGSAAGRRSRAAGGPRAAVDVRVTATV